MKIKRITTALLALLATSSVAAGVVISAGAIGRAAEEKKAKAIGDAAYFVNKEDSDVEYGMDNNSVKMGIKANLTPDDYLTVTNVINLQEMYDKDEAFIEILPVVEEEGKADYKRIILEVIDVYDETNFIKIQFSAMPQAEDASGTSYFLACASNGQKLTGYESGSDRLHINNEYGQWSLFAFGDVNGGNSGTGFFYDIERNAISAAVYDGTRRQIIDFDDPAYFGTYLWDGFTSNEVYCRIKCDNYKNEKAGILVSKYGNYDLSNDKIYDVVAPKLTVDYGEYTKDAVPSALVNRAYPIFPVTTFDAVDGEMDTNVKVYMNYYSSQPISVSVRNGAFTPKMPTAHYVVYSAQDAHGNAVEEVVKVDVLTSCDDLAFNFENVPTTCVEGNAFTIPAYTMENSLGNAKVKVTVTLNGQELPIKNNMVRPYEAGEMKVLYQATDYVARTCEAECVLSVTEAEKPTFIEKPILPKYLIEGNSYTLPALNAYDYVTGKGEAIPTTISVTEGDETKVLEKGVYVPSSVTSATVTYKAVVGDTSDEYVVTLPVYNVKTDGKLDMAKYFLHDENSRVETSFNTVDVTVSADTSVEYLNYVTALSLKTEFSLCENHSKIKKVHVYLTDIVDETKTLKFTYTFTGMVSTFYVNDQVEGAVEVSGEIEEEKRYALVFNAEDKKVYYDTKNNNILPVKTYLDGTPFEGFTNNKAYVKYAFEGVSEGGKISLNSLNGNYFNNETKDWIAPLIDLTGMVGGEYKLNDVINLPGVIANDVLSGDVEAYITVTSPSGASVTSVDGKKLDKHLYDGSLLQIKGTEYGRYLITIEAKDLDGNPAFINAVVWVVDTENPSLVLSGELVKEAKVGDKIVVPTVTGSDNLSEELTVVAYVIIPGGAMFKIGENEGFVAERAGVYQVIYYVSDEAGNFTSQSYSIKVS